jgi:hypothetical protein
VPLQRAVLQFAGLPGHNRTVDRLVSLVDGHLEAYGMADESLRGHYLSSALAIARSRFGIAAERRRAPRELVIDRV